MDKFNLFGIGKELLDHFWKDEVKDAFKKMVVDAFDAGTVIIKERIQNSKVFGLSLNDEENFAFAEVYAEQYLGLDAAGKNRFSDHMAQLTDAQREEVRMLIARRSQGVKVEENSLMMTIIVNPDGAKILKYLSDQQNFNEFYRVLERWGADKNFIDSAVATIRKVNQKISPFVNSLLDRRNSINQWLEDHSH